MTDMLRSWSANDPLNGMPSSFLNALQEMLKWYFKQRTMARPGPMKSPLEVSLHIQNNSGATLPQFAVIRTGGDKVIFPADADTSFFGKAIFKSLPPIGASPFAILQLPNAADDIVPAIAAGVSLVRIAMAATTDRYADCVSGLYTHLQSQSEPGPAEILWVGEDSATEVDGSGSESASGIPPDDIVWALVRLGGSASTSSYHLGLTLAAIPAASGGVAGSGPVLFYTLDDDDTFVSTGIIGTGNNTCDEIADGMLVHVSSTDPRGRRYISNACAFTDPALEVPCGECESVSDTYCVSFPGLVAGTIGCGDCTNLSPVLLTRAGEMCFWYGSVTLCGLSGGNQCNVSLTISGGLAVVNVYSDMFFGTGINMARYTADISAWDCSTDLTLTLESFQNEACQNWPATITVESGDCPDCSGLTVSFDDTPLDIAAATFFVSGTGFDGSTFSNNHIDLNLGATAHCTAATATFATFAIDTPPTTTGALTAVITVDPCDSGAAVQVATVAVLCDCDPLPDVLLLTAGDCLDGDITPTTLTTTDHITWIGSSDGYDFEVSCAGGTYNLFVSLADSINTTFVLTADSCDPLSLSTSFEVSFVLHPLFPSCDIGATASFVITEGSDDTPVTPGANCLASVELDFDTTYVADISTIGWFKFPQTLSAAYHVVIAVVGSGTFDTFLAENPDGNCATPNGQTATDTGVTTSTCLAVLSAIENTANFRVEGTLTVRITVSTGACP